MQMIVDIDEDYVKIINKNGASNYAEEVIKNGTPLPKGHGRLIDARKIYNHIDTLNRGKDKGKFTGVLAVINMANTIIEADNGSEENNEL